MVHFTTKLKDENGLDKKINCRLEWYVDNDKGLEAAEEMRSMGFPIVYIDEACWPKAVMNLKGYDNNWVWWFILNEYKINTHTVTNYV